MAAGPPPDDDRMRARRARRLYASEVTTGLGDGVFWVALIAEISGSASFGWLLTFAVVARLGPRAVLSIPAGALVDRSDPRRLMVVAETLRGVLMLALAVAVGAGLDPIALVAVVLLSYVIGVPTRPALAAATPYVVNERTLAATNATISALRQLMTFVGPVVGVGVVAVSPAAGFAVNGLSYLISVVLILSIRGVHWPARVRRSSGSPHRRPRGPAGAGAVAVVRESPGLGGLLVLVGAMYFVRGAELVLHVVVVRDLLGADPSAIGYLSGAAGAGAILATPFARRAALQSGVRVTLLWSLILTAVPTAALAVAGNVTTAALMIVPVGAGMVVFELMSVITVQRVTPHAAFGRVFGAMNAASNTGKLLGAVVVPALVAVSDVRVALTTVGAFIAASGLVVIGSLRRLDDEASGVRDHLAPVVEALRSLPLFEHTQLAALEQLAAAVSVERVAGGTVLIRQGDRADDLFIARSGTFTVTHDGRAINRVEAGDWFGEIGLVEDLARTASVIADDAAIVWRIPGGEFLDVLGGTGDRPDALVQGIADRLARSGHR